MAIRGSSLGGAVIPVGGPAGLPGQGTYDAWRALGNTGTLADFVAAQKGASAVANLGDATAAFKALNVGDAASQRAAMGAAAQRVVYAAGRPASLGVWTSPTLALSGDLSKTIAVGKAIAGADAAGTPTTGYTLYPELASLALYTEIAPEVGRNAQTESNGGRTGLAMIAATLAHLGNGDGIIFWGSAFANGARPDATHFLANPAVSLLGGQSLAGADGVLLQGVGDINLNDLGHDVAGIAYNTNLVRTNDTGALGADWMAYRAQSQGSKPIGAGFSATGPMRVAVDLTTALLTAEQAAVTLPPGARIYYNTTNTNFAGLPREIVLDPTWTDYDPPSNALRQVVDNVVATQASADQFKALVPLVANAGLTVNGSLSASGTIKPQVYTVATLPTPGISGRIAKASNGCALGSGGVVEAPGTGTGCLVEDSGSAWRIVGTNIPVSA